MNFDEISNLNLEASLEAELQMGFLIYCLINVI